MSSAQRSSGDVSDPVLTLNSSAEMLIDRLPGWSLLSILDWIWSDSSRLDDPNNFVFQFASRLSQAHAPIVRLRISIQLDHKAIGGWSAVWHLGQAFEADRVAKQNFKSGKSYLNSPIAIVDQTRKPYRKQLWQAHLSGEHPILHELKSQGATDYLALPVMMRRLGSASLILVSDRIEGFTAEDVLKFSLLAYAVASPFEVLMSKHSDDTGF